MLQGQMTREDLILLALSVIEENGQSPGGEEDAALILRYRAGKPTLADRRKVMEVAQFLGVDAEDEARLALAN
jgi:hypothetical protein